MFEKMNIFQILFHFVGNVHLIMMILDRYGFHQMRPILFFYAIVPFSMEIMSCLFVACTQNKIFSKISESKESRFKAVEKELNRRAEANLPKGADKKKK